MARPASSQLLAFLAALGGAGRAAAAALVEALDLVATCGQRFSPLSSPAAGRTVLVTPVGLAAPRAAFCFRGAAASSSSSSSESEYVTWLG